MSAPAEKVSIFVDTPNPVPPYFFELDDTTTIYILKQKLYMASKIPTAKMVMKYMGKECENTDTLKSVLKANLKLFRVTVE